MKKEFLRTFTFLKGVFRSPVTEMTMARGFTWAEVLFSYLAITFTFYFITYLFVFPVSLLGFNLLLPISNSFTTLIVHGFLLLIVWYALQFLKYSIGLKDLGEAWLVVWTLTLGLLMPLSILSMFIFTGSLTLSIAAPIVSFAAFGFLFFLILTKRFSIPKKIAGWTAMALSAFFILQALQPWWGFHELNQFGASAIQVDHLHQALSELEKSQPNRVNRDPVEAASSSSRFNSEDEENLSKIELSEKVIEYAEQKSGGDPKKKAAILQEARSYEIIAQKRVDHKRAYDISTRASGCLFHNFGIELTIYKDLKPLILDTPKKVKAYVEYNKSLSGKVLPLRLGGPEDCDE